MVLQLTPLPVDHRECEAACALWLLSRVRSCAISRLMPGGLRGPDKVPGIGCCDSHDSSAFILSRADVALAIGVSGAPLSWS